jgi:hypothetical protein
MGTNYWESATALNNPEIKKLLSKLEFAAEEYAKKFKKTALFLPRKAAD